MSNKALIPLGLIAAAGVMGSMVPGGQAARGRRARYQVTYNDGEYDAEIEEEGQDAALYTWVVLDEDGDLVAWFDNRRDAQDFADSMVPSGQANYSRIKSILRDAAKDIDDGRLAAADAKIRSTLGAPIYASMNDIQTNLGSARMKLMRDWARKNR